MSDWIVLPQPSPLLAASKLGDEELISNLLKEGEDVNETDAQGNTALIFAAANGHYRLTKRLIESGAKLNHVNKEYGGKNALFYARESGTLQIESFLVQAEVDQKHSDMKLSTTLLGAAQSSNKSSKGTSTISNAEKMAERRKAKLAAAGGTVVAPALNAKDSSSPAEVEAWFSSHPDFTTPRGEHTFSMLTCSTCGSVFPTPSKLFQHQGPLFQGKPCVVPKVVIEEGRKSVFRFLGKKKESLKAKGDFQEIAGPGT